MTLAEARDDLVLQSSLDVDLFKGTTLDAEGNAVADAPALTDLISRACQWWSRLTYCKYNSNVALTLTIGTDLYDCRSLSIVDAKVVMPRIVVINDSPLYRRDGKRYGLWTEDELQHARPTWRTMDDGTPDIAVWYPTNQLRLSAPPSAVYSGKNFIAGWVMTSPLTAGGSDEDAELPVPEEDHPSIIRLALAFGSLPNLSDGEAWQRASAMDGWWKMEAERRKRENVTALLGRKTRGSRAGEWLW